MSSAESKLLARIRQMQLALAQGATTDMSKLEVKLSISPGSHWLSFDPNSGVSKDELAVTVSSILSGIASLKDYLRVWCDEHGASFGGETLINSDTNVALIHDLWNLDKHAELNRKPRSGFVPRLCDLQRVIRIRSGTEANSVIFFSMDPRTGAINSSSGTSLSLTATVQDDKGNIIGEFMQICESAVDAWSSELQRAGVKESL